MCLRCSPGLLRHGCGAVSCHTSSMAANPHLALTKNSSPTTLANGRRAAQSAFTNSGKTIVKRTGGGGKPPPYGVGTNQPVMWFSVRTGGGTHRSRPTNHAGSPSVFVGDDVHIVPAVSGIVCHCMEANPYRRTTPQDAVFDGAMCGPTPQGGLSWPVGPIHLLWTSSPTRCIRINKSPQQMHSRRG